MSPVPPEFRQLSATHTGESRQSRVKQEGRLFHPAAAEAVSSPSFVFSFSLFVSFALFCSNSQDR